jgi:acetyl-CoA carboxylase carboxyltransferase component
LPKHFAVKRIENNIRIKLTARERVNYLMDEGSFEEIGMLVTHRTTDFGMEKNSIMAMESSQDMEP